MNLSQESTESSSGSALPPPPPTNQMETKAFLETEYPLLYAKKEDSSSSASSSQNSTTTVDNKVDNKVQSFDIYTDGACKNNAGSASRTMGVAGWGFVVVDKEENVVVEKYGSVALSKKSEEYMGAEVATNNTAELSGIGKALQWILALPEVGKVCLKYDSDYASKSVQGIFNGKKNKELIVFIRNIYAQVQEKGWEVAFKHVKGHSNNRFNDHADRMANKGTRVRGAECFPNAKRTKR